MTDPIEAMADSIEAQLSAEDGWYVGTPELRGMCIDFATAALAALRETLVPVGWVHEHERGESVLSRKPMTRGADELGWTETPLYSLPEIKP